jgi:uncharacterized protein (DUF736 family)
MEKYDNTNSGAIFKNDRKEKETHPDLGGILNVEGKDYYINAWKKTSKAGTPFYSLSVKLKEVKEAVASEEAF